jgi:hypothetical protein
MFGKSIRALPLAALLLAAAPPFMRAAPDSAVFDAPPAEHEPIVAAAPAPADAPLRTLLVEERMGVERKRELVRVPLFFHAGECADPRTLAVFAADDRARRTPLPVQADDIRRAADGSVARLHLYFFADLAAWERKPFVLVAQRSGDGAAARPVAVTEADDDVTFAGADVAVTFRAKGRQAGGIVRIRTPFAAIAAKDAPLGPTAKLFRQAGDAGKLAVLRENPPIDYADPASFEVRELKYAAGPVFAKLRVRIGPVGVPDALESTYLIPNHGTLIDARHRMLPEEDDSDETVSASWPIFLRGRVSFGDDGRLPRVVKIPAGVRELTSRVHGFNVEAAVHDGARFALINVPHVVWGDHGIYVKDDGLLEFMGPGGMKRAGGSNSGTLRAWWYGLRILLAPTTNEAALRSATLAHLQPLTAIVDEPSITPADLRAQAATVAKRFWEIRYWGRGWQQEAAIHYLADDERWRRGADSRAKEPEPPKDPSKARTPETDPDAWTPQWVKEQLAAGGTWPLQRPKGRDRDVAGRVDPYHLGYGMGSMPVLAKLAAAPRLDRIVHAVGTASYWTNGGLYGNGWPRITAFSNAYNMQIGSIFFGIYGGKRVGDATLVRFYRDVARSPGAIAIYGRGLRSYSTDVRRTEASDLLYQAICDLWLRTIELTCDENLMLHPSVFGRFSDAVDVTGDLQHRPAGSAVGTALDVRGNFFRTQCHDHRWEAWDAAPYIQMLRDAGEERPAGLTDAVYAMRRCAQGRVGWSTLMNFFHPLAMMREIRHGYRPPALPPLPRDVRTTAVAGGVAVHWTPVADAVGYRVYRAPHRGEPLTFVNSPYGPGGHELAKTPPFLDANGSPTDFYFVTAIDARGYESHWFPNEPPIAPGRNAARDAIAGSTASR